MSLAAIKRKIRVGTKLKLVRHDWFAKGGLVVRGNLGTTVLKPKIEVGCVRPVTVVHATEIALTGEAGTSWLQWPKAYCVRDTPNGFEIDLRCDGTFAEVMGYEFVPEVL